MEVTVIISFGDKKVQQDYEFSDHYTYTLSSAEQKYIENYAHYWKHNVNACYAIYAFECVDLTLRRVSGALDWRKPDIYCIEINSMFCFNHGIVAKVITANSVINSNAYPHKCPKCGKNAYIGFNKIEHENGSCS